MQSICVQTTINRSDRTSQIRKQEFRNSSEIVTWLLQDSSVTAKSTLLLCRDITRVQQAENQLS